MINEALATIDFKFRKRGENEMEIGSDIRDEMKQKRLQLSGEMMDCIDQEDDEYVSLMQVIQEHFAKRKFEIGSMADAKEEIGFMEQCMKRIREINRVNRNLQEKYHGDSKYVRIHKRIRKHEKTIDHAMLSDREVQQCQALNNIKEAIDLLVKNRQDVIFNEADFSTQVIAAVAQSLRELNVPAKPADRRYIAGLVSSEYLREFNVIR